jgi:hypothetical protein
MTELPLHEPVSGFSGTAFGSLFDFARLLTGRTAADVCDVCNTINMGSARLCKCCEHKLPAFYASGGPVDMHVQDSHAERHRHDPEWLLALE